MDSHAFTVHMQNVPRAEVLIEPAISKPVAILMRGWLAINCSLEVVKVHLEAEGLNKAHSHVGVPITNLATGALVNQPGTANPWLQQTTGLDGNLVTGYPNFNNGAVVIYPGASAHQGQYVEFDPPIPVANASGREVINRVRVSVTGLQGQAVTFDRLELNLWVQYRDEARGDKFLNIYDKKNSALRSAVDSRKF